MSLMIDVLQFEYMQNALLAGLLTSIICGFMGTLVVVNRVVFLSGGIAHAAYGGIGLAFFMGWPYLFGTLGFTVIMAAIMASITLKARHRADTIIGVVWALGMAFGIILLDLTPGYHVDLMSYLFGSILSVPRSEIWVMLVIAICVCGLVLFFYKHWLALSYDEEFARIRGVPVNTLYFTMIGMLALSIVMVIQVVGLILVIALLTIPPYIMEKFSKSLLQMMIGSVLLSIVFTLTGLWLSHLYDLTSGATIILVSGIGFIVGSLIEKIFLQRKETI